MAKKADTPKKPWQPFVLELLVLLAVGVNVLPEGDLRLYTAIIIWLLTGVVIAQWMTVLPSPLRLKNALFFSKLATIIASLSVIPYFFPAYAAFWSWFAFFLVLALAVFWRLMWWKNESVGIVLSHSGKSVVVQTFFDVSSGLTGGVVELAPKGKKLSKGDYVRFSVVSDFWRRVPDKAIA